MATQSARAEGSAALPPPLFAGPPLPEIHDAAFTQSAPGSR